MRDFGENYTDIIFEWVIFTSISHFPVLFPTFTVFFNPRPMKKNFQQKNCNRNYIQIPSCLKTPRWPIWVVEMGPENYAVISSTNPKLVADWRAELAFRLHIFDCEGLRSAAISDLFGQI